MVSSSCDRFEFVLPSRAGRDIAVQAKKTMPRSKKLLDFHIWRHSMWCFRDLVEEMKHLPACTTLMKGETSLLMKCFSCVGRNDTASEPSHFVQPDHQILNLLVQ